MTEIERLAQLIGEGERSMWGKTIHGIKERHTALAEYLLANGVIVTPCVAMVERFIKDGKFDSKHTAHNGRYAVVYVDRSKWGCPLIDITEQFYNAEKAEAAIKERSKG